MKFNPNKLIPRLSVADYGPKRFVLFGVIEVNSQSIPYAGNFWRWLFTGELGGRKTTYKFLCKSGNRKEQSWTKRSNWKAATG